MASDCLSNPKINLGNRHKCWPNLSFLQLWGDRESMLFGYKKAHIISQSNWNRLVEIIAIADCSKRTYDEIFHTCLLIQVSPSIRLLVIPAGQGHVKLPPLHQLGLCKFDWDASNRSINKRSIRHSQSKINLVCTPIPQERRIWI